MIDGKVVATNLLSETVVDSETRIVVKGSMEAKKEAEKPSLSTTAQASGQVTSPQARRVCRLRVTDKAIWRF